MSSGESSAATPNPALGSEGMTDPGIDSAVTLPGTAGPVTPKSDPSDALTVLEAPGSRGGSTPHPIFSSIGATVFHEGDVLGGRYEIQKLLGMGGMGAVYKARDMEVERVVGLKVIRPDLAGDPAILARFKQELVLARQVTHKNIIRIYDLNEADGVKFITMEFIEGEDLRSMLVREGKLSPPAAANIIVQVCAGLQAAHSEGVIHRDLKPSNVMCDAAGRVVIMDFGLARTVQGDGMTRTGMMVGTMEYMSPEQAMGKELDARSDQFTVGLIFYELLSGVMPYHAESAIASLVQRTQQPATPLTEVDPSIPPALSAIVARCLERDPNARFASMDDLTTAIEIWQGKRHGGEQSLIAPPVSRPIPPKPFPLKWVAAGALAAVVLAAGTYVAMRNRPHTETAGTGSPAVRGAVMSVAVLPFYNGSGDASLDWVGSTISDTLISEVGQSAHLHVISSGRVQEVLHDLRFSPAPQVDTSTLSNVKGATDAETVITGELVKAGSQFRINAIVHDLKNGRDVPVMTDVATLKDLPASLGKLAAQVREKLAVTPDIMKELQASSQHVLTNSITALQAYEEGLQLARAGNDTQAIVKFQKATDEDPNFAMAYSQLAGSYFNLRQEGKAYEASRRAVALSQNLPPQDQYRIAANDARIANDNNKAIAAYENLTRLNPGDIDAQFALAKLYDGASNLDEAKKRLALVLAADPKNASALRWSGRIEIESGNAQAALGPLNAALSVATLSNNEQEKGLILHYMGIAYRELNRPEDALNYFQQALDVRKKLKDQSGVAMSLGQIARIQVTLGRSDAALANYKAALQVAREINDRNSMLSNLIDLGSFYHDHGKYDDALKIDNEALQLARDLHAESDQALCLNNIGSAYNNKGEYQAALTYFQQAYEIRQRLKLPDATESLRNWAEMNFKLGQCDTAQAQFLKVMEASRAAGDKADVALASSTMGMLFAAQGKYEAALSSLHDAVNGFQQLNDRTWYSAEALARYGDVLSMVGRGEEAQKYLDEAMQRAVALKDDSVTAAVLNALGDSYFYRGQYPAARQQYEGALKALGKSPMTDEVLRARLGLARLDVEQGRAQAAAPTLKKIMQDASSVGLEAISVQASIDYAAALLAGKQTDPARPVLETALGQADKAGLALQQARADYLLGKAWSAAGNAKEAGFSYNEAVRILQSLSKQPGADRLLDRPDLKAIYAGAKSSSQGGAA